MPKVMRLEGGGGTGRWLGHEDRAFMNEISTLIKETLESSLAPSARWGHSEKSPLINQEESSPDHEVPEDSANALILNF